MDYDGENKNSNDEPAKLNKNGEHAHIRAPKSISYDDDKYNKQFI